MEWLTRLFACTFWSDCAKYVCNSCTFDSECSECCKIHFVTTEIDVEDVEDTEIITPWCIFRHKE